MVEINLLAVFGPETDPAVAVEVGAQFLPISAGILARTDVDAPVAKVGEIVVGGKGDHHAVRRKAERALADLLVVGQPLYLSGAGVEQIHIRVDFGFGNGSHVAVVWRPVKSDPL